MNPSMQATERNIPMKGAISSAEQNLAELYSRLINLNSVLHPILAPEDMDRGAQVDPKPPVKSESPLVMDVRNLAAGIAGANQLIEELISRIEV